MEMEDLNMELFMCTNYRVKLTMIFTCYKQRPRIFQILDSGQNEEVSAIPGIGRCCHVSCCLNSTAGDQFGVGGTLVGGGLEVGNELLTPGEEDFLQESNRRIITNEIFQDYDYEPIGPVYEQASFWVLFTVMILVIGIVIRSVYHTVKPNRLVELLRRMSTGPLSETKQGPEGNIEPVLHYYSLDTGPQLRDSEQLQPGQLRDHTQRARRWLRSKIPDNKVRRLGLEDKARLGGPGGGAEAELAHEQMLDARRLLTRQLARLEKSGGAALEAARAHNLNRPTLPPPDPGEAILETVTTASEVTSPASASSARPAALCSSGSIPVPGWGPLVPSYQPSLVVSGVWSSGLSMQRLYRYTTMQGVIYPPGYVP